MSTDARQEGLARRISELFSNDQQFADARPRESITGAIEAPGLRPAQIVRTVMDGYSDRPALGRRAVELHTDRETGRTLVRFLPRFETITYAQLWDRIRALTGALANIPLQPGDRVAVLGFSSVDYTTIDIALLQIGAVAVPLQTSAPVAQLCLIVDETEPTVLAVSIDHLTDAVELVLTGHALARLIIFDYRQGVDDQRDAYIAVRTRLAESNSQVIVEILDDMLERGKTLPMAPDFVSNDPDPMVLLIYTSGSTGTPKGAIYPERRLVNLWRPSRCGLYGEPQNGLLPAITLNFMPMSHGMGRATLYATLGSGGTAYFAAKSDLSTFLEDLALVRPTTMSFVPRIWGMLFDTFQNEVESRLPASTDAAALKAEVMAEQRQLLLGGRYYKAITGSAPITPEMRSWVESYLDLHLVEEYGSTEQGLMLADGRVQRPPLIDYKLVDIPELGYFHTDRPHPRGELLVKSEHNFGGYYKRPELTAEMFDEEGFYRTGDILAELGPDQLQYVDRRNNVLKLSQGEFVTISKLEAVFADSPLVDQIYIYGSSVRAYLLAVVVPTQDALSQHDVESMKLLISESLQTAAKAAGLQSYEIPRGLIVETTPFTFENGLLTVTRKLARTKLTDRYGERLEQLYTELAERQSSELRALRHGAGSCPVLETVIRAAGAMLATATSAVQADVHFTDLGGDSLSALTFADLLQQIFDVEVPVGVIVSPTADLRAIADYVEAERAGGAKRPTFTSVHGRGATEIHASDLSLKKFIDTNTLTAAASLPRPTAEVRTVLLTGATGFLGRYLALEWLKRLELVDGTLICLVRAKDHAKARERLDKTFDSGDPELLRHYKQLSAKHLEVLAGDKSKANIGLHPRTWQRLADTVDLIVDPAALVNHVLPYRELFGPNVLGTAELIRLAFETRLKPFIFVSTLGVGDGVLSAIEPSAFTENADIRVISPARNIDGNYANGYLNSKWAGEVLLREAHDLCGLPIRVFRCDTILAETNYAGQLNLPDVFTRLVLSLVATGIAPWSFYELESDGKRARAHYDALSVDFIAESISALGNNPTNGFQTYHVANPHDDGIGLDEYVDWLIEDGYPIGRIDDYRMWIQRLETALHALPEQRRRASLLPLLHAWQHMRHPICGAMAPTERFRSAVQEANIGPDSDIPHITPQVIVKYVADLELLGLL